MIRTITGKDLENIEERFILNLVKITSARVNTNKIVALQTKEFFKTINEENSCP